MFRNLVWVALATTLVTATLTYYVLSPPSQTKPTEAERQLQGKAAELSRLISKTVSEGDAIAEQIENLIEQYEAGDISYNGMREKADPLMKELGEVNARLVKHGLQIAKIEGKLEALE